MKNKVLRAVIILSLSALLYTGSLIFAAKLSAKVLEFLEGGAAGLALAGTISFVLLIIDVLKANKHPTGK